MRYKLWWVTATLVVALVLSVVGTEALAGKGGGKGGGGGGSGISQAGTIVYQSYGSLYAMKPDGSVETGLGAADDWPRAVTRDAGPLTTLSRVESRTAWGHPVHTLYAHEAGSTGSPVALIPESDLYYIHGGWEVGLAFNRQGTRLAFMANQRVVDGTIELTGERLLYMANVDRDATSGSILGLSGVAPVIDAATQAPVTAGTWMDWSPEGDRLVVIGFTGSWDDRMRILSLDATGYEVTSETELTMIDGQVTRYAAWCPAAGSSDIVFTSAPGGGSIHQGPLHLYRVDADTNEIVQLTNTKGIIGRFFPVWSPDGTTVAYVAEHKGKRWTPGPKDLYALDVAGGGNETKLPAREIDPSRIVRTLAWPAATP